MGRFSTMLILHFCGLLFLMTAFVVVSAFRVVVETAADTALKYCTSTGVQRMGDIHTFTPAHPPSKLLTTLKNYFIYGSPSHTYAHKPKNTQQKTIR